METVSHSHKHQHSFDCAIPTEAEVRVWQLIIDSPIVRFTSNWFWNLAADTWYSVELTCWYHYPTHTHHNQLFVKIPSHIQVLDNESDHKFGAHSEELLLKQHFGRFELHSWFKVIVNMKSGDLSSN